MRIYKGESVAESRTPTNVGAAAIAATTRVKFDVTVPGARIGDFAVPRFNSDPENGISVDAVRVTAANTVSIWLYNSTAGALPAVAFTLDAMVLPSDES